jgi:hypothetical protein
MQLKNIFKALIINHMHRHKTGIRTGTGDGYNYERNIIWSRRRPGRSGAYDLKGGTPYKRK